MRSPSLRVALHGDSPIIATFLMMPSIEVVEMLALAGFDAVIIDLEHGRHTIGDVVSLSVAAQGAGMYSIVRVLEGSEPEIGNVLDAGADGVLVPHVSTVKAAEAVVRAGRFPPVGDRSLNPYTRGNEYGRDIATVRDDANARIALLVMVEGAEGLENADDISRVSEIDAVFVGPVDLSAALGFPGQPEHPKVVEAVTELFARFAANGVASSVFAPTVEAGKRWLDKGGRLIALSADSAMVLKSFRDTRAALDSN